MGAVHPGAGAEAAGLRRVLVVKLSALGDVAHALPVIGFLAKTAPGTEVDWAVDRRFAPLLEGNPGLRRVVPLDIRRWRREWSTADARREALAGVRQLRRVRYDAAFDIQGNAKSGLVTRLSGAPLRFGFDRDGVRELPNLLFTNRKVAMLPGDGHIVRKYLRVVSAPFGGTFVPDDLRPTVAISPAEAAAAVRIVNELLPAASPRVALHAGSTWETKRMDPAFWAESVRSLRARFPGLGVLLSWGSGRERREAEEIRALAGETVEILPRLSLKELAAVYREVGHVMAPDTGPLHVAAAAGAKTVSVFRATDGNRNAPCGPGHRFLQAPLPCTACLLKRCPRDAECRSSILPSSVAEAFCRVVAGAPGAAGEG